eukprot:335070_1
MAEQVFLDNDYMSSDDDNKDDGFMMLTDDEGVQKKILLPGDTNMTPPKNATVKCHYIGKLMKTGQQFDTSRVWGKTKKGKIVAPKPFEFVLGQKTVIQMLDIGLSTMKPNEICILRCSPHYGYGPKGKGDGINRIPPNAWLEFEVECLGWHEWQNINNNHDLRKKVLVNGCKPIRPKPYDIITLSYKASIPSTHYTFSEQKHTQVICEDDARFPDGFHMAIQHMEEGEVSIIDILDCDLAFGAEGCVELNIPYFAEVFYEIHIHKLQIVKDVNEHNDVEKIAKAKKYKVEGNELIATQSFDAAIKKYNHSLKWITLVEGKECIKDKLKMMVDVYNNMALISMKRGFYDEVISYSNKVLQYDEGNVKALSRSGHAKIIQCKYNEAKMDLKKAKAIDATNDYIKKLLKIAITKHKKQKEREIAKRKEEKERQRKQYQAMFGYRPEKQNASQLTNT